MPKGLGRWLAGINVLLGLTLVLMIAVGSPAGASGSLVTRSPDPTAVTSTPSARPTGVAVVATSSATAAAQQTATPTVTPTSGPTAAPTAKPTPKPTASATAAPTPPPTPPPAAGPCPLFPATNVWNRDIAALPVRADSDTLIASIGLGSGLHPDFSAAGSYGIPINVVSPATPRSTVSFQYAGESDAGPYPIPANPLIEGGSDRHLLMWDTTSCMLYELFAAARSGSTWTAGSGAIWDLRSNALRPDGWTSADAAGLPILPGLVRYEEVAAGAIHHALRFTAPRTQTEHIYPARHDAGESGSPALPPMGLRVRLKASVDISSYGPQAQVLLTALKRYGMILADNGSPWYVTGAPDARWNDDELHNLHQITGADFEVVDTSGLVNP